MNPERPPEPEDVRVILMVLGVILFFIFTGMVVLAIAISIDWRPG